MDATYRIGVPQSGYSTERNILGSIPTWARRVRPIDPYRIRSGVRYRLTRSLRFYELFRFCEPYAPRVDLLHFFNTVADTRTPWLCTFEHCLPRWDRRDGGVPDPEYQLGARMMRADSCRRLIAYSDASRNIAANEWRRRLASPIASEIESKVEVLLPPQAILREPTTLDNFGRPLLSFIGADFYRKGGLEALRALDRLSRRGIDHWRAVFVGRLSSHGDYASATGPDDERAARELLYRMSDQIIHHERLPANDVIRLLCQSSYCLLPTLADTFGYSALEAMACGAVVIATNVRAMAEVVDDAVGYSLPLPLDENRDCHTHPEFARSKSMLIDLLEVTLLKAMDSPESTRLQKAIAAQDRLRHRHDPASHAARIERIYLSVLGLADADAAFSSTER